MPDSFSSTQCISYFGNRLIEHTYIPKKYGAHKVLRTLEDLFGIHEEEAIKMFTSKTAGEMHHKDLLKTLYTLKDHDIPSDQLQRIPWIMTHTAGEGERQHSKQH